MAYKGSGDEYLHSPPTAIYMQKKEVAGDYVGNNNNEESKPDGS